ncbi:uncharacterized protein MYCGRDRAFT_88903 [Zymoseptoria tritici IPO323]|uniref:Uncharacterized protein n=1 Tax=Zymoseptoria tritici (strain CBS 115943 / IPO323) TaxID=336722 RepID=F9WXN4_ZYMTI|nr:uncharacterized protein MYCGRDRAFT_88903 [Zymoseptoria tritici IPO323]EGP90981.1 hypothetical protein MYCGRDRAFT_88903 [Zymoseptoria tritici IPO323]
MNPSNATSGTPRPYRRQAPLSGAYAIAVTSSAIPMGDQLLKGSLGCHGRTLRCLYTSVVACIKSGNLMLESHSREAARSFHDGIRFGPLNVSFDGAKMIVTAFLHSARPILARALPPTRLRKERQYAKRIDGQTPAVQC